MLVIEEVNCPAGIIGTTEALLGSPYTCLLDSSLPSPSGRWSFLCTEPFLVMTFDQGRVYVDGKDTGADPFGILSELLDTYELPIDCDGPPFTCGAVGYFSYDLGRHLEKIPSTAVEDLPHPAMCLAFYDCVLAFDNFERRSYLSYLPSGRGKARNIKRRIKSAAKAEKIDADLFEPGLKIDWSSVASNFSQEDYLQTIRRVKDYIAAGDVYQINLTQRFSAPFSHDPWMLYKALRRINPSPFASFLDFPELTLVSASPERLLSLDARTRIVETKPIKGTRPRGRTVEEDERLRSELAASEKDRAENVMIVDMERNDLGKVCEFGSVNVPSLWHIEDHPNVFQMVSTVKGKLRQSMGPSDLIRACFPGGSITGAPKVHAMELIEDLEPNRRGIYTGSVGYIDFRGNMDLNIIIRSFILRNQMAYFHGGGGILADSVPESEYQETLDKVSGLVSALNCVNDMQSISSIVI